MVKAINTQVPFKADTSETQFTSVSQYLLSYALQKQLFQKYIMQLANQTECWN